MSALAGDPEALRRLVDAGKPIDGPNDTAFVVVEGGPFAFGHTQERVDLPTFAMAQHPVTNAQWARFLEEHGYVPKADPDVARYLAHWVDGAPPEALRAHPVVNVSLADVSAYAEAYGFAVPTEVEWEKAARSDDARPYPWGILPPSARRCHVATDSTCAVGSFPEVRTAYGCQDMVGNVSEITLDQDPDSKHVVLKGSAYLREGHDTMHVSHRRRLRRTGRNRWVGFRPALVWAKH